MSRFRWTKTKKNKGMEEYPWLPDKVAGTTTRDTGKGGVLPWILLGICLSLVGMYLYHEVLTAPTPIQQLFAHLDAQYGPSLGGVSHAVPT